MIGSVLKRAVIMAGFGIKNFTKVQFGEADNLYTKVYRHINRIESLVSAEYDEVIGIKDRQCN